MLRDKALENDVIYQRVKQDLAQRYPKTQQTGRPSTLVEVVLRMLVITKSERAVKDSLVLRWANQNAKSLA